LPAEMFKRWEAHLGVPIYQVYGSTEVGHVCYSRIGSDPKSGTIGVPLASRECLVVDPTTLTPVEPGKSGELIVSSPHAVKTYWNKPEETRKLCVEIDGKVFCRMGDFVRQDDDGEFIYVERSADIIKHKGFRISASEVEAILQDHPTVIGACVVGVPDPRVGERVKAIVVLKEDARGVGGAELLKFCRKRLATYKVPSYIEFRDMLPKSKVGKLLRREVRDEERRRMTKEKEREEEMDIFTAIKERRSCRKFLKEPIDETTIEKVLEAATWAPSPMNYQPWEFIVASGGAVKEKIHAEAERCRQWAIETSGWKWLEKYKIDFLLSAPISVAVVGDPQKTGLDMFMEGGGVAYQHACAAAIQNIQLAAHAEGLASIWFTMFDKANLGEILGVASEKVVVGLVCLGKADGDLPTPPRKDIKKKTTFLR